MPPATAILYPPLRLRAALPRAEFLWLGALLLGFLLAVLSSDMNGYQGSDDARYVAGAEAWLAEGIHLARNHWETRLPYVLLIALFGTSPGGLLALHVALGLALIVTSWALARPVLGPRPALAFAALLALSPFVQQLAGRLAIEALELLLAAGAFWLVRQRLAGAGMARLAWAGSLLGLAILTRQTSAALAIGLGLMLLLRGRWRDAFILAGIAALPLLAEALFYALPTGDPLARLHIDMRHVQVEGQPLPGGAYTGGSPLFNADLASKWQNSTQGVLHLHWTVDAFLRLVTYPSGLLTWLPALALLAWPRFAFADQAPGLRRDIALTMAAVYLVVVFVLCLAPEPRYFSLATYLACLVTALGLARLAQALPRLALAAVALLALAGPVVADLNPTPRGVVPQLLALLQARPSAVFHVTGPVEAAARLALRRQGSSGRISGIPPTAGDLLFAMPANDLPDLTAACPDGSPRLRRLWSGTTSPSLAWRLLELPRLGRLVPAGPANWLQRERYRPALFAVGC